MNGRIVLIDIATCCQTISSVIRTVEMMRNDPKYEGYDIFIDGDMNAVVAEPKRSHSKGRSM